MTTASKQVKGHLEVMAQGLRETGLVIGSSELVTINICNRLEQDFDYSLYTRDSVDQGIQYLTDSKVNLVIVDIDELNKEAIERFYKILAHIQVPCLFIGSDSTYLNSLREKMDSTFVSFLPKTILNTMLKDTVTLLLKKTGAPQKMYKRFLAVSNHKKPFSFYALAFLLICEPVLKIMYLKFHTGFEWDILFRTIFSIEGMGGNFEFWGLFPLAGYALLSVSSWSFLLFIGLQAYSLIAYFTYEQFTWPYVAESPFISVSFLVAINTFLVGYFAVPANRRPYWNQMRRIWRNTSRYTTSLKAQLKHQGENFATTITNISETGAYLTSTEGIDIGDKMQLQFDINGEAKSIDAIVRRSQDTACDNHFGYGVEFEYKNRTDKVELKDFVNSLNQRIQ